ncbi:MAG TPA: helix-turn-helix domain-containing protein [Polyangiaceae bacterium]|nr:helix-turn-helix domain-containing protein [Polyangiaceae bacterium]
MDSQDSASNAVVEARSPAPPVPPLQAEAAFATLKVARREAIDRFEAEYVRQLLRRTGGNVTRAASLADVSRQIIHKLIAKHRL